MKIETDINVTFEGAKEVAKLTAILEHFKEFCASHDRMSELAIWAAGIRDQVRDKAQIIPVLFLCACLLPASPILSDGNETCLPAPCAVQVITPHPSWLEAQWISHVDSGANASMLTVPNGTVVSFYERFTIAQAPSSAPLRFAADDSAALWVNGSFVIPAAPQAGNGYSLCSDTAPTCWAWITIDIAPWLAAGDNVLRFDVEQRGRYGYGLAFEGDLVWLGDPPLPTPEPGTWWLAGLVFGIAGWLMLANREQRKWKRVEEEQMKRFDKILARIEKHRIALIHISENSECLDSQAVARKALEK